MVSEAVLFLISTLSSGHFRVRLSSAGGCCERGVHGARGRRLSSGLIDEFEFFGALGLGALGALAMARKISKKSHS